MSTVQISEVPLSLEEISSRKFEILGTVQTKMGTIKDRNGMELTEAEEIKKRWQEYTDVEAETPILWPPDTKN